jgi:hypothetical protein
MHKLRVIVALVFAILIVWGLTSWFKNNQERTVVSDPLSPIWTKITTLTERFGFKKQLVEQNEQTWSTQKVINDTVFQAKLHPDFQLGSVNLAEVETIMQWTKTFGSTDASIVLLQWCDFWSTYCIESYEQGGLFAYMNAFPEQLQYQLHGFTRDKTEQTALQHTAALCAQQNANHETYLSYYFSLYQEKWKMSKKNLISLAEKLNISWFAACLEKQSLVKMQKTMQLWRSLFEFATLPANVLVDKQTWQYILIPWLYDQKDVLWAIQWMIDQR